MFGSSLFRWSAFVLGLAIPCLASSLFAGPPVVTNFEVLNRGAEGALTYLIDADAVDGQAITNRHTVEAEASFTVDHDGDFRIEYLLVDESGSEVAQAGPFTYLGLTAGATVDDPQRSISGFASPLDPYQNHRLRVRVDELIPQGPPLNQSFWFPQTSETEATGRQYLHFDSTDSSDAALNVIPVAGTAFFGVRKWILDTMTDREYVLASVDFDLHRYDGWDAGSVPTDDITVEFEAELRRESDDALIPLNDGGATVNSKTFTQMVSTDGWRVPVLFRAPTVTAGIFAGIRLDPAGQLDGTDTDGYYIRVVVKHVEVPGQLAVAGETRETNGNQIFHFNGNLAFGSISPMATTFSHVALGPSVLNPATGLMDIFVDQQSGVINGQSNHSFGDGSAMRVLLQSDGDAVYTQVPGTVTVNGPAPDAGAISNVRIRRENLRLTQAGLLGTVSVDLPAGAGFVTNLNDTLMEATVSFASVTLDQDLEPSAVSLDETDFGTMYVHEETKPVWWQCGGMTWFPSLGQFDLIGPVTPHSVRKPFLDALESIVAVPVADREKVSNDHYWNHVQSVNTVSIQASATGAAMLSADAVALTGNETFKAHFPKGTSISWVTGSLKLEDDLLDTTASQLTGVPRATIAYAQHCRDALEEGCVGADESFLLYRVTPDGNTLDFTPYGGLHTKGDTAFGDKISWGKLNGGAPAAHSAVDSFTRAHFMMAGHFVPSLPGAFVVGGGPGIAHLAGVDPDDLSDLHLPGDAEYESGIGDYAGVNLRVTANGVDSDIEFQSVLGGSAWNPYALTPNSKFYLRTSGVSGVQQAPGALGSATGTLYGFNATLDTFGLAWLSNDNRISRTDGSALVPLPSDFTVKFDNLFFSCLGAPSDADIVLGEEDLRLDYWDAPFRAMSLEFLPADPCDPSAGCLAVQSVLNAQNVEIPLVGQLGFGTNGDILAPDSPDNDCGVTSEFTLPGSLQIRGPRRGAADAYEQYAFTPVRLAYLNRETEDNRPAGADRVGFWNLAGTLDVPFFRDLAVHGHTSANPAEPTSNLFMTGGFAAGGETFFTDPTFDGAHAGRPTAAGALAVDAYRESNNHRPLAQQVWLEVIDFNYPLEWNSLRRTFRSSAPLGADLIVLSTQSRVDYLSPRRADLSFNAEFTGVPPVSISNAVFNSLDENLGVAQAIVNAAGDEVLGAIEGGVDSFANLLSDRADRLFDEVVGGVVDPSVDVFFENVKSAASDAIANQQDVRAAVTAVVDGYLRPGGVPPPPALGEGGAFSAPPPPLTAMRVVLGSLVGTVGSPAGLVPTIDVNLDGIETSVFALVGNVGAPGNPLPTAGLLGRSGVNEFDPRPFVATFVSEVVGQVAAEYANALASSNYFSLVGEADAALDEIQGSLEQVREAVETLRAQLLANAEFLSELEAFQLELDALLNDLDPNSLLNLVADEVQAYLDDALDRAEENFPTNADVETYLDNLRDEIESRLRQAVMDRLMASNPIRDMHEAIRERLQVVHMAYRAGVDAAFDEINEIIRKALSGALAGLDETFNDFGQEINKVIKTARVTGHGQIMDDALRELSLNAKLELGLPEDDPLRFDGYVKYQQLNSAGPGGCPGPDSPVAGNAVEITLGVRDAGLEWISDGMRGSVEGQLGIATDPLPIPISIGGSFSTSEGSMTFASAEVEMLAGTMKVGLTPSGGGFVLGENYLGLAAAVRLSSAGLEGGIFVGRSCDLEPIRLLNPQLGDLLGDGGFAGGYVFGAGRIPIVDFGCALNLSAGVGAGAFFSLPGPTWGGVMQASARGEALCIFSVKGDITLIGLKRGDQFRFSGQGRLSGKVGACPLCKRFRKTVRATLEGGRWDVDY